MSLKHTLLAFFSMVSMGLFAQDALVTDRPDQTEASSTVGKNVFQIESGTYLSTLGSLRYWGINNNLFRYGVNDKLEFRLVTEVGREKVDGSDEVILGISDLQAGIKVSLFSNEKVEGAFMAHGFFPTGSGSLNSGEYGGFFRFLLSHPVTDRISFGYNLGYGYYGEDVHGLIYTYSAAFSLNDKIGYFIEFFGGSLKFEEFTYAFDSGFTYLINNNLQLDFSLGKQIEADAAFYSAGISYRIK